jgi:GTP-binding protein Era
MKNETVKKCGFAAIVGRPNVGKSTLLNHVLGQKISITSHKPQTTRHRILGIKSEENVQVVYVDTPGIHLNARMAINRYMNKTASTSLRDVDVVLFVVVAGEWSDEDQSVLDKIKQGKMPTILVINKIDHLKEKSELLAFISKISALYEFLDVVPISAYTGDHVDNLEQVVESLMPESVFLFPDDQVTDKSERFLVAEIIREKLIHRLHQELPYSLTVEVEKFADDDGLLRIDACIWVERDSQKGIVIGKGGSLLKQVGKNARIELENTFECKVFLNLWVKVKEGWADNEKTLHRFGYSDDMG